MSKTRQTVRGRGRPPGATTAKSRDPDYMVTSVYVRRAVYADVRDLLFRQNKDFSDLVGELLDEWLKEQRRT
jgi:hypothetical protein